MPLIVTRNTDQHQAKYGYCSCCFNYQEVYRKDNTSKCWYSEKKLYHIPAIVLNPILMILFLSFMVYISTLKG